MREGENTAGIIDASETMVPLQYSRPSYLCAYNILDLKGRIKLVLATLSAASSAAMLGIKGEAAISLSLLISGGSGLVEALWSSKSIAKVQNWIQNQDCKFNFVTTARKGPL